MKLLIPGPVSTAAEVRAAMAQDYAPWDNEFRPIYAAIRERIRELSGGSADTHVTLVLGGAGHNAIEACVRTFLPPGGRILVPAVGAYADRIVRLAREADRDPIRLEVDQNQPLDPSIVAQALANDPTISHVGLVHSETGTGVIHDPAAIGAAVRAAGRRMILDAVSAFGALPLDAGAQPELDAFVFTANKCFEGTPGLAFVVARIDRLDESTGNAHSWALDLADILAVTRRLGPGSIRYTPPAQCVAAFQAALRLYDAEGGQPARLARYTENASTLHAGLQRIGISPVLPRELQGPIVLNAHAPADPAWNLQHFVDALKRRGYLISNFYNTPEPSFRVGCIGNITPADMHGFIAATDEALTEIGIRHRAPGQRVA